VRDRARRQLSTVVRLGPLFGVLSLILISCQKSPAAPSSNQGGANVPASSASDGAVKLDRPGLPNLHKVTDRLYRGAQPTAEGFVELQRMGIKSVINLRTFHSDAEHCQQHGLRCFQIHEKAWHPEDEDTVEFLRLVTDPANQPVFVHCQHGADRTGVSIATYRIAVQGWSKDAAIEEMTQGGFGFHSIWTNLVTYVRNLDVVKLRRDAGLASPGTL